MNIRNDLAVLGTYIRKRLDEARWAREVAYIEGPTCIQYSAEPHSHSENWPMTRAEDHPLERIAKALESAKPSNVKQLRGVKS